MLDPYQRGGEMVRRAVPKVVVYEDRVDPVRIKGREDPRVLLAAVVCNEHRAVCLAPSAVRVIGARLRGSARLPNLTRGKLKRR